MTMLLRRFMLCALYILTLCCCARFVNPEMSSSRLSKVILLKDGEEDETRYQQVLEDLTDSSITGRRPLVEERLESNIQQQHRTGHNRQQHRTDDTRSDNTEVIITYEDDTNSYISSPETELMNHEYYWQTNNQKKRTRNSHGHLKSSRKLPQAIIIGVKKGGTRALLEYLRIHPDVRAPGPEPHFFDRNYDKGLEWYRHQMPPTSIDQFTIEKTPSYFVTKGVPGRIFNMSKNVKFLVVVRDPVTRAISDYTQALAKRTNISSFESMAFEDNSTGLVDTSWGAIRIGVYAKHLERWLQYFPLSQMHFVSGEKLISDPAGVIGEVQDFLGLPRIINEKNFFFNSTKGFPCLIRPDGNPRKPHCLGKTKGREHPRIDPKVLQRLKDFFRPFNQKFYQMVGQDFGWS